MPTAPSAAPIAIPSPGNLPSSEFGLALGYVLARNFFNMRDLHYGYWPADLAVEPQNLHKAQIHYTDFLMSHIPAGVRTILDVGMGAGNTARRLIEKGYRVDGVSPNGVLTDVAKQTLGDRATIFEARFQDLQTERRYDLVLFSESLLFIPLTEAFTQALRLLNPGGHVLITDIFRVPAEGKSPIGGGHELPKFRTAVAQFPLESVADLDMTDGIAPTFDLLDRMYREAIQPAYQLILARLTAKYPWVMKFVRWKFRKKIDRYEQKHFSGRRNGANFKLYKSYRLLLYRRRDV